MEIKTMLLIVSKVLKRELDKLKIVRAELVKLGRNAKSRINHSMEISVLRMPRTLTIVERTRRWMEAKSKVKIV